MEGGRIMVLDETLLPFEEKYIEVKDIDEALEVLGSMKTRAFGQVLLYLYTSVLVGDPEKVRDAFSRVRPTFDFDTLCKLMISSDEPASFVESFIREFDGRRRKRVRTLSERIGDGYGILTICNVSGELVLLYEELLRSGKRVTFYVSETRPYLQGTRLTYYELELSGANVFLVADAQAAHLMECGIIDAVVVGSDRSTTSGYIVNKVGTYSLAVLSKLYNIPFYVLVQFPSDIGIDEIEIEERDPKEVFMWTGFNAGDFPPTLYPSFDVVPPDLITERFVL